MWLKGVILRIEIVILKIVHIPNNHILEGNGENVMKYWLFKSEPDAFSIDAVSYTHLTLPTTPYV